MAEKLIDAASLKKVAPDVVNKTFHSFDVKDGDILHDDTKLYRVNRNGLVIALDKYDFDFSTGEFYRIVRKIDKDNVLVRRSHEKRWLNYQNKLDIWKVSRNNLRWIMLIVCGLLAVSGVGGGAIASLTTVQMIGLLVLAFVSGITAYMLGKPKDYRLREIDWVGPEPFKRKIEDFGPGSVAAPVEHPAGNDLAY